MKTTGFVSGQFWLLTCVIILRRKRCVTKCIHYISVIVFKYSVIMFILFVIFTWYQRIYDVKSLPNFFLNLWLTTSNEVVLLFFFETSWGGFLGVVVFIHICKSFIFYKYLQILFLQKLIKRMLRILIFMLHAIILYCILYMIYLFDNFF